jgi:eukaryotic-like serine/threonine-protein kinase
MSPEQAAGKAAAIGPATDIYALGAILYELLTGRPPIDGATELQVIQSIQEREPVPPRRLRPKLPRDLNTICLKCLQKEPSGRYDSAAELAGDLRRFLRGEPIQARPQTQAERLWRWCRRNPLVASLAAAIFLLLVSGTVLSTLLATWAIGEKDRAEGEQQISQRERDAASAARDLAEERFALARQAVDRYLTDVTDDPSLYRHQHLRKKLLESALPFYQKFVEQKPANPAQEEARGLAYDRLAFVHGELGQLEHVIVDCEQMRAIFQKLSHQFPEVGAYRWHLARSHHNLGLRLRETGRVREAEAQYKEAIVLLKKLADDFPTERAYRRHLASGHNTLGILYAVLGPWNAAEVHSDECLAVLKSLADLPTERAYRSLLAECHNLRGWLRQQSETGDAAEAEYEQARVLLQALADELPAEPASRHALAMYHYRLARRLREQRQRAAAADQYRKTIALQQKLAEDFPAVPEYRQSLAQSHLELGIILVHELKQESEGEAEYRKALALQKQLVEEAPTVPFNWSCLGAAHHNLGILKRDRGDLLEARQLVERAVGYYEQAVARAHGNSAFIAELAGIRVLLGDIRSRQGDHAGTAEVARELGKVRPNTESNVYDAACFLTRASALAEKDAKLSEQRRKDLARSYADEAMEYLRQAVTKGYRDVADLRSDTDLNPLRSREDFQKLLAELAEKGKAGDK